MKKTRLLGIRMLVYSLVLILVLGCKATAQPGDVSGYWAGATNILGSWNLIKLRIEKVENDFIGTMDVPSQNILRLPLSGTMLGSVFSGKVNTPRGIFNLSLSKKDNYFVGTIDGSNGMKGNIHFISEYKPDQLQLTSSTGHFEMSNSQRAVISYNPLNQLDVVFMENINSMKLTRVVSFIPQDKDSYITSKSAIAKPEDKDEVVTFYRDNHGLITGFSIKGIDGMTIEGKKIQGSYTEEEVTIQNGNIKFGGTLFMPVKRTGKVPALLTLTGAGPVIRTNTVANLRARIIAETMGIAVLICDKRGTGDSSGSSREATYTEYASDAIAALKYLVSRPEVNPEKTGLLGISQSGWTVPIALKSELIKFAVIVSGSPLPNEIVTKYEIETELKANKFSELEIQEALKFTNLKWHYAITGDGWPQYEEALKTAVTKKWFNSAEGPTDKDPVNWKRMRLEDLEDRHIEQYISNFKVPTLFLFGDPSLDVRIPVTASKEKWVSLFEKAAFKNYTIIDVPGTGHAVLFKTQDNTTMKSVEAVSALQNWMNRILK